MNGCRNEGKTPDTLGIIASLLPKMPFDRLSRILLGDPPARKQPVTVALATMFRAAIASPTTYAQSLKSLPAPPNSATTPSPTPT